jgi:hypothetical protein
VQLTLNKLLGAPSRPDRLPDTSYGTKPSRPAVQELLPSGNDLCWISAKLLHVDELHVRMPVDSLPQPLRVQRTHGNHHRLSGLQAVPDERHYAGGEVGGVVPGERLVPIALLRSGRCECDDDPLLRTTGEANRCPSGMSRFIGQDLLSRHEADPVY